MYNNPKRNAIQRSHLTGTKGKIKQGAYIITQISKKGYEVISYQHLSQVLDYFKSSVYPSNQIKLNYKEQR